MRARAFENDIKFWESLPADVRLLIPGERKDSLDLRFSIRSSSEEEIIVDPSKATWFDADKRVTSSAPPGEAK
jgi:hypothetical protein